MTPRKRRPQGSGTVRQLPSRRWQARYRLPDGTLQSAPVTFDTKLDATAWLADYAVGVAIEPERRDDPPLTDYADAWLAGRELKPRTRELYRGLLDDLILPELGRLKMSRVTPARVRGWYAALDVSTPTRRAHAYALLRTMFSSAVADDVLDANPCRIRGAGHARRKVQIRPATLPELETIVAAMPDRYRLMGLFGAWCALRFGELTELRRSDVDTKAGRLRIRRGVTHVAGAYVVGTPKSDAGARDVAIPPHLAGVVKAHLLEHTQPGRDGLLFPGASGEHMAPSSLYRVFYRAREKAGRPDLRFHDLRHTGAVLAAATGATLAELMGRLGHSTPAAAMRYQHASADRDQVIAAALSDLHAAHTARNT
ncbi:MAG: site-specific integrase [Actinomycetota bacterium]|nr:site-specific integrase [Actinomycetota bacterium]